MNMANMTVTATVVAAALGLAPGLATSSVQAHHDPDHNQGGGSGNPNSESNDKVFPVKVTFDDIVGDSIRSDGGTPYVNGLDGVRAEMPVEGSPPGQLIVDLGGKEPRTFSFDLGLSCDFDGEAGVQDGVLLRDGVTCVECPFGTDGGVRCAGSARGTLAARDPLDINGGVMDDGFILTMDVGALGLQTRAQGDEVLFRVGNQKWSIDFDDATCEVGGLAIETFYLDIRASDAAPGLEDPTFRENWEISTDASAAGGSKTGCLSKFGPGANRTTLLGNLDLTFGYTVCILADPDVNNDCILE